MIFGKDYATIYDALYKDQNFAAEARAVAGLSNEMMPEVHRATLLDLGCGTGSHTKFFKDHFTVTGVDLSEEMLELARTKNPEVPFQQGDARTVSLDKQFDVVVMMSAVMGYQHTNQDVMATLRNVRKHLRPGGLFVFDIWYGPAILLERPASRLKELKVGDLQLIRSMRPALSSEHNLCTCYYKWWMPEGGNLEIKEECHTQRYFFPVEMQFMLESAGFSLVRYGKPGHVYRPISDTDRDIMFVARG